jgi:molybdenum cofactor cytidylyltransferase
VVLLAAGSSSRLGKPKQLLLYKGKSFLQNMVSAAIGTNLSPVIVVLGAHAGPITDEITGNNVHIIHNQNWEEGIASSIRSGIQALEKINPVSDAVILMVCDQPYITTALLNDLFAEQGKTGKPIVAAYYSGIAGTPVLFHKKFFPELLSLKGDKGAGKILQQQVDWVATISFPMGVIDIDTTDNYEKIEADD